MKLFGSYFSDDNKIGNFVVEVYDTISEYEDIKELENIIEKKYDIEKCIIINFKYIED